MCEHEEQGPLLRGWRLAVILLVVAGALCSCDGSTGSNPTLAESTTSTVATDIADGGGQTLEDVIVFEDTTECDPAADDADVQVAQAFVAAYNGRDLTRIGELFETPGSGELFDESGVTFSDQVLWTHVQEWATAAWKAGDRFEPVRLFRFGPNAGSELRVGRTNDVLRSNGIENLTLLIKLPSNGCVIQSMVAVVDSGDASNCSFYDEFLDDLRRIPDTEWSIPQECATSD